MQVLFTIVLLGALGMWAVAIYNRLGRLRAEVTHAWQRLEPNPSDEAVRTVYNRHVTLYNDALEQFPATLIAPLAGFKPARVFEVRNP
jgi:hypothetical protein